MLWPTDDCSDYDFKLEEEGWPRASVVVRGPTGQPRLRMDQSEDTRYLRGRDPDGKGVPDCRYCGIWCRNPRNKVDLTGRTADEHAGRHSPRNCPFALAQLVQMKDGTHFISDRSKDRYK